MAQKTIRNVCVYCVKPSGYTVPGGSEDNAQNTALQLPSVNAR